MSEARSRRAGGTPWSEPMRGGDAPGSYHRTFGNFLGVAGGQTKIAPWGVAGGKNKSVLVFEPVEALGGQVAVRKRGTSVCRHNRRERTRAASTRAASSVYSKTPLYAYTRSSLHLRLASNAGKEIPSIVGRFSQEMASASPWKTSPTPSALHKA